MRGEAKVVNPDNTQLQLTVSMTVAQGRAVVAEIGTKYPEGAFKRTVLAAINATVDRVESVHEVGS